MDGTSGVLTRVLMNRRGVGTAAGFLSGNGCWCC